MSIYKEDNDIWIVIDGVDIGNFVLRLGCGGAISNLISEVEGEREELLSASFKGERTDRIIQWTLWSNSLIRELNGLPKYEWRFNVTQGGDFDGNFSLTQLVSIDDKGLGQVDIYSTPTRNWKTEQQDYFSGGLKCLTRYTVLEKGVINVTRILKPSEIKAGGAPVSLGDCYLEAWTPLSSGTFNQIIMSLDEHHQPLWYYSTSNLPTYPSWENGATSGYFISRDTDNGRGETLALVFGKEEAKYHYGDRTVTSPVSINTMRWGSGFGLLPALQIPNWTENGIVRVDYTFILNSGLTDHFVERLDHYVQSHRAPEYWDDSSLIDDEQTQDLVKKLDSVVKTDSHSDSMDESTGISTDHLGTQLTRGREAISLSSISGRQKYFSMLNYLPLFQTIKKYCCSKEV